MENPAETASFTEALSLTESKIAERFEVTAVNSVWSPTIIKDKMLAKGIAEEMADLVKENWAEISEIETQRLVDFGAAVGALALRKLFTPFVSDQIWIEYREGSGLTEEDAIRRIRKGLDLRSQPFSIAAPEV